MNYMNLYEIAVGIFHQSSAVLERKVFQLALIGLISRVFHHSFNFFIIIIFPLAERVFKENL